MGDLHHIRASRRPGAAQGGPSGGPAGRPGDGGNRVEREGHAPQITSLDPCAILRVQTWDVRKGPPSRAEQVLGLIWPKNTGTTSRGRLDILCIGPTDWLLLARDADTGPLLQALNEAFVGSAYRATDVSSALARIQIEGAQARALLAKACSLDVHPEAFPPNRTTRTRFAGMPVVVRCTEASVFECIVSLSYREYLLSWLHDAAVEF